MLVALALATTLATPDTLAGVTLGEETAAVIQRLGLTPLHAALEPGQFQVRVFPASKATMSITFDDKIRMIAVMSNGSSFVDPYGVKLGDSLERLLSLRGNPTSKNESTYQYGSSDQIRWEYDIKEGSVAMIIVADCRNPGFCTP
jgi:hypothetical protein